MPVPTIVPSGAPLGAEVRGVDIGADPDESTVNFVRDALHRHKVVVLRGQKITPEQVSLGSVDADAQSFWQLRRSINDFDAAGRRTAVAATDALMADTGDGYRPLDGALYARIRTGRIRL